MFLVISLYFMLSLINDLALTALCFLLTDEAFFLMIRPYVHTQKKLVLPLEVCLKRL